MLGVHVPYLMCTLALLMLSWTLFFCLMAPFLHSPLLVLIGFGLMLANVGLLASTACTVSKLTVSQLHLNFNGDLQLQFYFN